MLFIRQGATHKVVIGPVVAVGDGFTPVTTLSVATADEAEVILHDNGTIVDISGYTFAAITTADGYYHLTLQSGISGTVGHMTVVINDDSLCLPAKAEFTVIEEAVYDAFYAASATGVPAVGALEATSQSILTDTGTTLQAELDGIQADTEDIQSRLPAALVSGRMDSNASAISGVAATADRLEAWFNGFITGTVEGTPSTTVFDSDVTEATNDHFNHMIVAFTGGALLGQSRRISDYAGAAGTFTVQPPFTEAPGVGDIFIISPVIVGGLDANGRVDVGAVGGTAQTAGDIIATINTTTANVSVDEIQATALADLFNTDSGTTYSAAVAGSVVKEIADNASGTSAGSIADAVWDEAIADHTTVGSTGEQIYRHPKLR